MAVNSVKYARNTSFDTNRGPSAAVWANVPAQSWRENPALGTYFFDDFNVAGGTSASGGAIIGSTGQWASYVSQGGLIVDQELEGGVIGINSDGDQESVTLAGRAGSHRITTTSTLELNGFLAFECRVAVGTIATTKMDCFVGLADKLASSNILANTIPISTTDDTLSTAPNLIGFHKKSGSPTDWTFVYQLAAGTAVYPTNLTTLVTTVTGSAITAISGSSGFVKLGFVFDPFANPVAISSASTGQTAGVVARPLIRVYVNGKPAAAFLTSTNVQGAAFPTGFMAPVISNMQTATGANTLYIDWIGVAQKANS